MIALNWTEDGQEAKPMYYGNNPPMVASSRTNILPDRQFSQLEAPQLGNSTTRVRLVPLNASEYQETSQVDLLSIGRDELLLMRRQLLQKPESSKKPSELEVINSKNTIRKGFSALLGTGRK